MITSVSIENYKSISSVSLDFGRITVLIGANGSGKSNILEAIALSAAASNDKLDNEFLASRGIRITPDRFMKSAFDRRNASKPIRVVLKGTSEVKFEYLLQRASNEPYSPWVDNGIKARGKVDDIRMRYSEYIGRSNPEFDEATKQNIIDYIIKRDCRLLHLDEFLIYSPEILALRSFEKEGQIEPLGRKGEGLFKLLTVLNRPRNIRRLMDIKEQLQIFDWFSDFDLPEMPATKQAIRIRDRFLDQTLQYFDQRSANEGFLFVLFYFCLFASSNTPKFFAIDNIDSSLNPKLCAKLMVSLNQFAKSYGKKVILTTHNPAILDGIDLNDRWQKLYVVSRDRLGQTMTSLVSKPKVKKGQTPIRLSEAFLRGYIGGLPKNF